MSIDRLLSQYSAPVGSWPGEEGLDEEARANLAAASTNQLPTEGGAIDAGRFLPITRYPPRVGSDPATWKTAGDVLASLDDGWRLEPFNRISAPFQSMLKGLREQPLLGPVARPSQMHPQAFDQMTGDAMSVAGAGVMGNIPRVLAGAPAGTIDFGIFGGRRGAQKLASKGEPRPLQALDMVEAMEKAGKSRDEIWQATAEVLKDTPYAGAFRGVDQKPKFEIDDSATRAVDPFNEPGMLKIHQRADPNTKGNTSPVALDLDDILPHDPLRAAYDHTDLPSVSFDSMRARGSYSPGQDHITLRNSYVVDPDYGRSTLLHELQHAVQAREGTAMGGNPGQFERTPVPGDRIDMSSLDDIVRRVSFARPDETIDARSYLNALWDHATKHPASSIDDAARIAAEMKKIDELSLSPEEQYRRLAGEVEARTVQARRDLSPEERRARPPWMDDDVPEKDQIVRFGGDGKAASIEPDAPHPIDKLLDEVAPPLQAASVPVPASLDPLGYYSPAAEAARGLKQLKGTPEQMLAQLKKAGARDAEIEATGLAQALAGKKSVTRDEIVKHLEGSRVGLTEVEYRKTAPTEYEVYGDDPQKGRYFGTDRAAAEAHARETGMDLHEISPDNDATKWSSYSLDPANPTYRETVLHLPDNKERQNMIDVLVGRSGADPLAPVAAFQSGHFPEPNIVGHMMTSMVILPAKAKFTKAEIAEIGERMAKAVGAKRVEDMGSGAVTSAVARGAVTEVEARAFASARGWSTARDSAVPDKGSPVFLIDQIQSDWGQKLRDGGVRDEAKIAELRKKFEDANASWKNDPGLKSVEADAQKLLADVYPLGHAGGNKFADVWDGLAILARDSEIPSVEARELASELRLKKRSIDAFYEPETARLRAELSTANASASGHPLVNTTDQWVNTTLRRAIRQAAEADAEYIAIPSGRTVESYNPQGSSEGVDVFYDKIVPKNLRNLLQKIDKSIPAPQRIETLDSPSGTTGLGQGFTLFPLTPAVKERVLKGGQPLFKAGGAVLPSRVPDFTPAQRALQEAVPRRGARDANEILDLYSKD